MTALLALAGCAGRDPLAPVEPDGGAGVRCAPSVALVGRVDPARLRADLDALVDLGERSSAAGQARAAATIGAELARAGLPVREQAYVHDGERFVNLEVTIAGAEAPAELVIAGAHVDARPGTPGADDNASGAAAVLEAARALAGCRPKRTIRLLFLSNEERDRAGALAYVGELNRTVVPRQVVGFIALDMVAFPPADRELALFTRPAHRRLGMAMLAAVARWTALRTTLSIGDDCG